MFSLCRLCAKIKDDSELSTQVFDLQSQLSFCCGWKPSEDESGMPKKACGSCVEQLNRSWEFAEAVWAAEKQLQKLSSELNQVVSTEFVPLDEETEEISVERIKVETPEHDIFTDDIVDDCRSSSGSHDKSNRDEDGSNEHIPRSAKINSKKEKRKLVKSTPSLETLLDDDERLGDGTISANGVKKIKTLFPETVTFAWSDCKFKCKTCNLIFNGRDDYYAHIHSIHFDIRKSMKHQCFYCNSKFQLESTLDRHISTEHFKHLEFRCYYCTEYFWDIKKLMKHRKKHTDAKYKCGVCGLTLSTRRTLYGHMTITHRKYPNRNLGKKFACDICTREFNSKSVLKNHLLRHVGEKEYICDQCGYKCATKGNIKSHVEAVHAKERAFQCKQCDRRYKTERDLKTHAKWHGEQILFECSVCNKKLRGAATLTAHMRIHSNAFRYSCRYCDRKFNFVDNRKVHERTHTNEKPYACQHCDYRCTVVQNLNKHIKRIHSKTKT